MRHEPTAPGTGDVFGALIDDSHFTPPDRLGSLVARYGQRLGAEETVIYLSSLDERTLRPLSGLGVPDRAELDVDDSVGGRAFRMITAIETEDGDRRRAWLPLLDGTARLGLLEVVLGPLARPAQETLRQFAGIVAELVVSRSMYGDLFVKVRRNQPLTLAAELQWSLLPPQTFNDDRVTISGLLEPAYDIAGDSFDYAFNGDLAHFGIFDAMGHGFEATLLAAVAIAAYRHGRRADLDLPEIYGGMHAALAQHFTVDQFVTAQLGRLNAQTGELTWLNAGHPPPMHLRGGKFLGYLECEPTPPLGIDGEIPSVSRASLEPGDHLLFYTDGLVEARSPEGEFFGAERLAEFMTRARAAELPPAETARRLMHTVLGHQQNDLQDDATTMLITWHGPLPE